MLPVEDYAEDVDKTGSNFWNYYKVIASLTGRAVLAQKKANVGACVPIRKMDKNRYVEFKIAWKILNKDIMAKERPLSCSQAKKSVLDSVTFRKRNSNGRNETF